MTPQYTVLRIKRKATDAPLSSLVISGGDSRAAKRRTVKGRGVFRLADTVPDSWQGQGAEGDQLKTRIEGLMSAPSTAPTTALVAAPAAPPDSGPSTLAPRSTQTQYRVVPRPPPHDPNLPPRVITLEEIEAARSALHFVDAQAVTAEDREMAAFQSMLAEYLNLEGSGKPEPKDEDEYVYDLYYRDVNGDAGEGEGIGALLGYEDLSPPSTPPDSEPEDEADEDSNDEDYYRNDYPEDEDADEDMEGFEDAYSDGEWSRDEDEGADERDPWDGYR